MKTFILIIIATAILLFVAAVPSFAVDGLQVSVQDADATLTWPSKEGETFVVQYRHTLDPSDSWQTLAPAWPAAAGTNVTSYVHYGIVQYPPAGSGGGTNGGNISPFPFNSMAMSAPMPLVMPANGTGAAVPLALYPPGMDLSGFTIFDPVTRESVSGNGYTVKPANKTPNGDMQPMDASADSTNQYTGFYRVLGVRLVNGLTNGMTASDYLNVTARPEIGPRYLDLMVDGRSFPNQDLLTPPFTNSDSVTFQYVDTAGVSNGVHTLQVEGGWFIPSEANSSSGYEMAYSQPVTIYVTNEISYPDWDGDAGDGWASFNLQSAHPVVDWEIDIYNYYDYLYWYYGYTDTIVPIHIATGSTTNGLIDYQWNLTDDNGNVRTNLDNDPYFFSFTYTSWSSDGGLTNQAMNANGIHPNAGNGGSAQKANPIAQNDDWPTEGGYWVVAYQDMYRCMYDDGNLMHSMLNGWLGMAAAAGNPIFYRTPTSGTNAQTFPLRYNSYTNNAFINTNADYNIGAFYDIELLNNMLHDPHARNFYGFGHGTKDRILGLDLAEANLASMHRYRFVWMDGCNTATGDWDRFFHINGPGIFSLAHYIAQHLRPALFVGHTQEIPYAFISANTHNGITYDGTIPSSVPYFRSNFVFDWWQGNATFSSARSYAIDNTPSVVPPMRYSGGPLQGQVYNLGDSMQIEGYDQMHWNQYNAYSDLPW
jgi:hypothetical protein